MHYIRINEVEQQFRKRVHYFVYERERKENSINHMLHMDLVSINEDEQSIVLSFPVKAWALNPAGNLHGGIICSLLDVAMGCISYACSDAIFTPTIQMSVNFVKGILPNDIIYIEVFCDHVGKRMIQTRAIARNQNNIVVASAHASYAINTKKK